MEDPKRISPAQLASLQRALQALSGSKADWTREASGVYVGNAEGWRVWVGSQEGMAYGAAAHPEMNVELEFPAKTANRFLTAARARIGIEIDGLPTPRVDGDDE